MQKLRKRQDDYSEQLKKQNSSFEKHLTITERIATALEQQLERANQISK